MIRFAITSPVPDGNESDPDRKTVSKGTDNLDPDRETVPKGTDESDSDRETLSRKKIIRIQKNTYSKSLHIGVLLMLSKNLHNPNPEKNESGFEEHIKSG